VTLDSLGGEPWWQRGLRAAGLDAQTRADGVRTGCARMEALARGLGLDSEVGTWQSPSAVAGLPAALLDRIARLHEALVSELSRAAAVQSVFCASQCAL
jgi:hypothetical protein